MNINEFPDFSLHIEAEEGKTYRLYLTKFNA